MDHSLQGYIYALCCSLVHVWQKAYRPRLIKLHHQLFKNMWQPKFSGRIVSLLLSFRKLTVALHPTACLECVLKAVVKYLGAMESHKFWIWPLATGESCILQKRKRSLSSLFPNSVVHPRCTSDITAIRTWHDIRRHYFLGLMEVLWSKLARDWRFRNFTTSHKAVKNFNVTYLNGVLFVMN
jgi:hypothetical protein